MIKRKLEQVIDNRLNSGKAIIILGPRQVGKTTLLKEIDGRINNKILWLNGDESQVRLLLKEVGSIRLKQIIGNNRTVKCMLLSLNGARAENILSLKHSFRHIPNTKRK